MSLTEFLWVLAFPVPGVIVALLHNIKEKLQIRTGNWRSYLCGSSSSVPVCPCSGVEPVT
jgi:hypothetical protein